MLSNGGMERDSLISGKLPYPKLRLEEGEEGCIADVVDQSADRNHHPARWIARKQRERRCYSFIILLEILALLEESVSLKYSTNMSIVLDVLPGARISTD